MSRLSDIVASKEQEVRLLRAAPRVPTPHVPIDVLSALRTPGRLGLIAEVKLRSPSAGALSGVLSPAERALRYCRAGASMVSVLCDRPFFGGGWDDVSSCRAVLDRAGLAVPLLAKEFVLDPRQVEEARDRGADAVLLIARISSAEGALARLVLVARDEGLEPLVEVVDEAELDAALEAGARLIGVNARDLDTLAMDAARAARVLERIPPAIVAVHLSGLKAPADVLQVAAGRADAALIGEALMRQDEPSALLSQLLLAAGARGAPGHAQK